jgi:Effector-associated domain 7
MNDDLVKIKELIETALSHEQLLDLCFYSCFKPVYETYSQANRNAFIRELFAYAEKQNEIEKLLTLIEKENPSAYQKFIAEKELLKKQNDILNQQSIPYKFPESLNFDLDSLVSDGMNKIIGEKGLIGISMYCKEYDHLATNFCLRLGQRIGRGKSTIVQPITINYLKTVQQAFNDIKSHQEKLKNQDVICLIKVDINNDDSTTLQDLWSMVHKAFENTFEHRLIIVMVSARKGMFPQGVPDLESPRFQKADAQKWISDIIAKMQPTEEWNAVEDRWLSIMIRQCKGNDPNSLGISEVYDHLKVTLNWLKESPSPQEFLQKF